jgi:biopolymer transport protein TolR
MAGGVNMSHRRGGSKRRSFRPSTDINITPLVDVMLVLMVIFMVTAPMLTVGVPVDLPKTQAAKMNDQVEPVVISIDATGKTYLQEQELALSALIQKLSIVTNGNMESRIYVRGDKKLTYGQIMEIMGAVAAAGFNKVSLIAEMPTAGAGPSSKKPVVKP